ncbi:Arabinose efflux permease [Candidatus Regiella insecticola 5.15]|uniref:Arabinose efflux permease n=1 Tax=Candidatus Regiella insecticola 5.15 TaxID=1005043 RepID=G2H1V3_9ENTR|nr:MFS transporter [Candidatus Regiella insecticola]EGY28024.1 Arabinose efflux permease [Candidatus Regiella insecticola 5.15]
MNKNIGLVLLTALMMFPQIVETIYSPALTHIAHGFKVSAEEAAQTLSLYFFAFALGVVFWGRVCDIAGRRPAILGGLLLYSAASLMALFSQQFAILLVARMFAAFGAAVGSIGTQTMIRDTFQGAALARVFSVMGVALAVSPGIGMLAGGMLTQFWGYQGVFAGLTLLAAVLVGWSVIALPETRPNNVKIAPLMQTFIMMVMDMGIWCTAFLVALFNVNLFSYYQLAPFHFEKLGLSPEMLGYSGLLLTLGVGMGAWLNKFMLKRGYHSSRLVLYAAVTSLIGSIVVAVLLMNSSRLFILPILLIVMAYGIAIPNILTSALAYYVDRLGTAGALLGLFYYLLLGCGLALAGWSQHLGLVLICSSVLALPLAFNVYLKTRS